jgi:hypothetical protein
MRFHAVPRLSPSEVGTVVIPCDRYGHYVTPAFGPGVERAAV